MSYTIGNIIYGFELNNEMLQYLDELDPTERLELCRSFCVEERLNTLLATRNVEGELSPIEVLQVIGFEILYCSGGCDVGYFGTLLHEFDETNTIDVDDLILTPTPEQIEEVKTRLKKFPPALRQLAAPCKVYIVWASS